MTAIKPGVRKLARRTRMAAVLRSAVAAFGYHLISRDYYGPIPDVDRLPHEVWDRKSELGGLTFDTAAGGGFARRELGQYIAEYSPPRAPTGNLRDFYLDNTFYEDIDAQILYAMIRRFRPHRVIELGSGMSTLVIGDARAANGQGRNGYQIYDPYPRSELAMVYKDIADLHPTTATDVPLERFAELGSDDLLFVDTTHTVKIGGDVNRLVLDVLPMLAPGVLIHFHDIFLPWDYPRDFLMERRFFWAEQYLLQAFLAFNGNFEVLLPSYAVKRLYPEVVAELFPGAHPDARPSALWMRRKDPQ